MRFTDPSVPADGVRLRVWMEAMSPVVLGLEGQLTRPNDFPGDTLGRTMIN